MILAGAVFEGLLVGLAFTLAANGAICASLLFPDDVHPSNRLLLNLTAVVAYVFPQVRLPFAQRRARRLRYQQNRARALQAAADYLKRGQPEQALQSLDPVRFSTDEDLLVAVRFAQAYTAARRIEEATAAWVQVRKLDAHKIYRDDVARHLHELEAELARSNA